MHCEGVAAAPPRRSAAERDRLVCDNQPLARYAVKRFRARCPGAAARLGDPDELLSEANLALVRAAERWDPARSQFSTFALRLMLQALAWAARGAGTIRVPPWLAADDRAARQAQVRTRSFGQLAADNLDGQAAPFEPADAEALPVDDLLLTEELRGRVAAELRRLHPRLAEVARLRWLSDPPATLAEVGAALGVVRERARALEAQAARALRRLLADLDPAEAG